MSLLGDTMRRLRESFANRAFWRDHNAASDREIQRMLRDDAAIDAVFARIIRTPAHDAAAARHRAEHRRLYGPEEAA